MGITKRKFLPKRLLLGAASSIGGIAVLIVMHSVTTVLPVAVVIGVLISVPVGVLTMLSSFGRICAACEVPLEAVAINISGNFKKELKSGFKDQSASKVANLYLKSGEPSLTDLQVKCNHCPECKNVGVLSVAGWGKFEAQSSAISSLVG